MNLKAEKQLADLEDTAAWFKAANYQFFTSNRVIERKIAILIMLLATKIGTL
jgi:hypothetical protein